MIAEAGFNVLHDQQFNLLRWCLILPMHVIAQKSSGKCGARKKKHFVTEQDLKYHVVCAQLFVILFII